MTLEQWLDANDNRETCNMAGDLAFDAIAGYHGARDLANEVTAETCRERAADLAFAGRKGWDFGTTDPNDPAGEIARAVLDALGWRVASGSIGFDAVLAKL